MIAAGLCLMGGCFAQDESSQVVETYWPAHSVRVEGRNVVLKPEASDLTTPIWREEGLYIEARVENLSWTVPSTVLYFGLWSGTQVNDAFYMSTGYNEHIGPQAYSVGRSIFGGLRRLIVDVPSPIDYMHAVVHNLDFSLDIPGHYLTARASELGSEQTGSFPIRLMGANKAFDFVVSGWCDDVRGMYYMNQPLLSVSHAEAVFTHGFNILTEL